jgi:D-sedoheptulose 7-phosphate isomerase
LASEFVNLLNRNSPRKALPAIALTSDSALITSIANDMGYDSVFERQIDALGQAGDVLIAISGSGKSKNIIRAITCAKDKGLSTIGLTGNLSPELRDLVDIVICAPSLTTSHIQELHLTIGHILCAIVEQEIFDIQR